MNGSLLFARVACCRRCGVLSPAVVGKRVRETIAPQLKSHGWVQKLRGNWHCPKCGNGKKTRGAVGVNVLAAGPIHKLIPCDGPDLRIVGDDDA